MSRSAPSPDGPVNDPAGEVPSAGTTLVQRGERLERNAALLGVPVAVVPALVVALVLHPVVGVVIGIAILVAWELIVRQRILHADERVVAALATTELRPGDQPRLENLVDGLCATNGVASPQLRLLDAPGANAAVAAVDERVTFLVTSGLLERLDRMELEGVVANLVARARDGSAGYSTLVLSLLGTSADGGPAARRCARRPARGSLGPRRGRAHAVPAWTPACARDDADHWHCGARPRREPVVVDRSTCGSG